MTLKAMYNHLADQYHVANLFGSISNSHQCVVEQIQHAELGLSSNFKVLDLGVGNGMFLEKLQHFMPYAEFTGIDVSSEMLKRARERLPLNTIECSATEADQYISARSQDLVLAHFINAYIPIHKLFKQASTLTRDDGHFSLITTTYDSFPMAQKQLAEFITKETIISRIVGHYYKAVVKNTTVAAGEEELLNTFAQHHFEVVAHQRLQIPITLKNIEELAQFGIEGTWFLNSLSIRVLPRNFLLTRLKRMFSKIFTFPYHDTHVIDVILAKKLKVKE